MKILLIDDDMGVTKMMSNYLQRKNHTCVIANDGRTGISIIDSDDFDVILLDLAMPNVSGYDVLNHIINTKQSLVSKVIIFTAVPLIGQEKTELFQKGVLDIFEKPIALETILKKLEKITSN